jgi:2-oxoisovalerate dehydrogenase E1 component
MKFDAAKSKQIYATMVRIRAFEDTAIRAWKTKAVLITPKYTRGTEAVSAGVCAVLGEKDYLLASHRPYAPFIARGARLDRMMAEIYCKATGYSKGKGGGHHMAVPELNILGSTGIVGSHIPASCGAGLTCKMQKLDRVCVCFFGDGATSTGAFHESLGMASIWDLPVIYLMENNQYANTTPISEQTKLKKLSDRAKSYGMPGVTVDGNDVYAVADATAKAIRRAKAGKGPTLIEALTYITSSSSTTKEGKSWRSQEELEEWKRRDPIDRFRMKILADNLMTEAEAEAIKSEVAKEVEDAVRFAIQSPSPDPKDIYADIYCDEPFVVVDHKLKEPSGDKVRILNYADAIQEALIQEMARDPNVFLMGESSQTFERPKAGLTEKFGTERVRYTPIAETAIIGTAMGSALTGMRPIAEIIHVDFTTICMDQIVNQVAKWRYSTGGGALKLPVVIRTQGGNAGSAVRVGSQHEQSLEAFFTHVPGMFVVMPSTPFDAKGLLKTCIRGNDPVLFVENYLLYDETGPVPEDDYLLPLGKADIKRKEIGRAHV